MNIAYGCSRKGAPHDNPSKRFQGVIKVTCSSLSCWKLSCQHCRSRCQRIDTAERRNPKTQRIGPKRRFIDLESPGRFDP